MAGGGPSPAWAGQDIVTPGDTRRKWTSPALRVPVRPGAGCARGRGLRGSMKLERMSGLGDDDPHACQGCTVGPSTAKCAQPARAAARPGCWASSSRMRPRARRPAALQLSAALTEARLR